MTDRELDMLVHVRVMGCDERVAAALALGPPSYTTSADADYTVLQLVRETWSFSKRWRFCGHLAEQLITSALGHKSEAFPGWLLRYVPGDFAKAALAVVGKGGTS